MNYILQALGLMSALFQHRRSIFESSFITNDAKSYSKHFIMMLANKLISY